MLFSKLEVLVDLGAQPEENVLERTLKELNAQDEVKKAVFKDGAFMVETTLPSSVILDMVAKTSGKRAVLQGFGDTQSAVAMVSSQSCCRGRVMGVVRLQQTEGALIADGTVHGLRPGAHGLHVHDTGDLSRGCSSIGSHYNPQGSPHGGPADPPAARHAGDLGNIVADEEGRATFRIVDRVLKVWDIVGRSIAVSERADDLGRGSGPLSKVDGNSGDTIACGVIARSAGVFENPKRVCACDGVVVWDERDRPLAGTGRRDHRDQRACCGGGEGEKHSGGKQNGDVRKPCCKV